MNILLIWPNSRNEVLGWGDLGAIAEPLALEYLAAGVKQDGHSVRVLDLRLHPDALVSMLRDFRPDIVGVTAFSMHVITTLAICARVKSELPDCCTVIGGHHATFLPRTSSSRKSTSLFPAKVLSLCGVSPMPAPLACLCPQYRVSGRATTACL